MDLFLEVGFGNREKDERRKKLFDQILNFAKIYAQRQGYVLNPNKEELERIIWGLVENQLKYGFRYCPCRVLSGDRKEDAKKICPCYWHKREIEEMGHCHCRLFWDPKRLKTSPE